MTQINRWFIRAAIVLTISALCSCASTYTPDQSSVQKMSVEEARNIVHDLTKPPGKFVEIQGQDKTFDDLNVAALGGLQQIDEVSIRKASITVIGSKKKYYILLKDIEPSESPSTAGYPDVYLTDRLAFYNPPGAERLADALLVLKSAAVKFTQDDQARFQEAARSCRASAVEPQLPEAARRFEVQAEGAFRDKDFEASADYYERALEVAPCWPAGHYNRALMLAGADDFPDAIVEMKRYLTLVPDAPNARAVQDKIYDWERKASTAN